MKQLILLLITLFSYTAYGQSTTITPGNAGNVQLPKLSFEQINAISNPKAGMMVFDSTFRCLKYYNGSQWLCTSGTNNTENPIGFAWQINSYGMSSPDLAGDIFIDKNRNIYSVSFKGFRDTGYITIIKHSPYGSRLWEYEVSTIDLPSDFTIDVDNSGNIYALVLGSFRGSDTYDLIKLNDSGNLVWRNQHLTTYKYAVGYPPAPTFEREKLLFIDENQNIYVTGSMKNRLAGMPTELYTELYNETFIAKFSSNGTPQWSKKCGYSQVSVDKSGNSYFAGLFDNSVTIEGNTLNSIGYEDIVLGKFDTNGNLQWIKRGGSIGADKVSAINLDKNGSLYITGSFSGNAWFDGMAITANDSEDYFIAKYRADGQILWLGSGGGAGNDKGIQVEVTANNDVVILGESSSKSLTFHPGVPLTITSAANNFIIKHDGTTGNIIWVKNPEFASSFKVSPSNEIYLWYNTLKYYNEGTSYSILTKLKPSGEFAYRVLNGGKISKLRFGNDKQFFFIGTIWNSQIVGSSLLTSDIYSNAYISHWMEP